MTDEELIEKARSVLNPRILSPQAEAGGVAAAVLTKSGAVYVGVCVDTMSAGMCAERVAVGTMITAGENIINTIVAVKGDGEVLPPCGVCREFLMQIQEDTQNIRILLPKGNIVTLKDLLPYHWWDFIAQEPQDTKEGTQS